MKPERRRELDALLLDALMEDGMSPEELRDEVADAVGGWAWAVYADTPHLPSRLFPEWIKDWEREHERRQHVRPPGG